MKEIKDYLHLYKYVMCVGKNGLQYKLHGTDENMAVIHERETGRVSITYAGNLQPILRPLSSMTEDERREVFKIVFGCQFIGDNICRYPNERVRKGNPRWVLWSGVERLGIEDSGYIWADSDLSNWHFNQHEVTRYLLSNGIDLFGLIEAGLAIDATKIPST